MSINNPSATNSTEQIRVELIQNAQDFKQGFEVISKAFGGQTGDELWTGFNPGWDTPEGQKAGSNRLETQFLNITHDKNGNPNTLFLKATVPDRHQKDTPLIVGLAIWKQLSVVEGYGDAPQTESSRHEDVQGLYPDNEPEGRFLFQALGSLHKLRNEIVREKASATPPAVFQLDLCVTDPAYQRRGIASKLVEFGLDEAKRRGGIECVTQASSMGRGVYLKAGFIAADQDIVYELDSEFAHRNTPPNVFMRTGSV